MKPLVSLLCQSLACATLAQSASGVREMILHPEVSLAIPVARDRLTTVRFPSPPTALEGLFLAPDPEPSALFQLSFRPGQSFFSVRALVANARGNLNVVWKDQTYVLELFDSPEPLFSLILKEAPPVLPTANPAPAAPAPARRSPDAARLGQLLSLVAARTSGESALLLPGVEATSPNLRWELTHYDLLLREIIRFPQDDTSIFCVGVRNKSDRTLIYHPRSFAVLAGSNLWTPSRVAGAGIVPPKEVKPLFLAVTGGVNGVPSNLRLTNRFRLVSGEISVAAPRRSWLRRLFRL